MEGKIETIELKSKKYLFLNRMDQAEIFSALPL